MRHKRVFSGARSDKILSALLGLAFSGRGGLMIDSTAEHEDARADGCCRLIAGFRPLGNSFGYFLGGSFNVRQELIDCSRRSGDVLATIQLSFSPYNQRDKAPTGAFQWSIEPGETAGHEALASWTESINTDETARLRVPELRIKAGSQWAFRLGHNRLIQKAALQIAEVLSNPDDPGINFAEYAMEDRLNFWPAKCGTRKPRGQ
jgi:hypothetical protein